MRTTLTLDDDVARLLARTRRANGKGLKEAVNDALRRGLAAPAATRERPYRMRPRDLGPCRLPNLDCVAEVLAVAEGEDHR
jgi:hypothetical protein